MGRSDRADDPHPGDRRGDVLGADARSAAARGGGAGQAVGARDEPFPAGDLVDAADPPRHRRRDDHRRAGALARQSRIPVEDAAAPFCDRRHRFLQGPQDHCRSVARAVDRNRLRPPLDPLLLMELDTLLRTLEATGFATAIRENESLFPWIESLHVLAITLVVGSIAIVDLRLIGLASLHRAAARLTSDVLPCTWPAFALAAITGSLLFSSNAFNYAHNAYFQAKFVFLALAGLNMAVFHLGVGRAIAHWGAVPQGIPPPARLAAGAPLLLWIRVGAFAPSARFHLHS